MSDSLHPAVRAVIDLFAADLATVKFPDVDAAVLTVAADAVAQRAEEVARAEAALEQARLALTEAQEGALIKAHRAVGYAKVFADDDAALASKLEAIALPRPPRRQGRGSEPVASPAAPEAERPTLRRRRSSKGISTSAPLFGELTEQPSPAEG